MKVPACVTNRRLFQKLCFSAWQSARWGFSLHTLSANQAVASKIDRSQGQERREEMLDRSRIVKRNKNELVSKSSGSTACDVILRLVLT